MFDCSSSLDYDAVVVGGGDGTLTNVLTAITKKTARAVGKEEQMNSQNPVFEKPKIPVAILPVDNNCIALLHASINMMLKRLDDFPHRTYFDFCLFHGLNHKRNCCLL